MLFISIQYAFVVYMVGLPTQINLTSLSRANNFYRPKGSVCIKEHAFPRSSPIAFAITAITSLRKNLMQVIYYGHLS